MARKIGFAMALLLVLGLTAAVAGDAKEVKLQGKIACAKCTLKVEGATDCQSVFVVDKKKEKVHYYLVDNDVAKEYGHVCMGEKGALITGTVEKKDGKMWITASKMEEPSEG
jgi:hypothetical protein